MPLKHAVHTISGQMGEPGQTDKLTFVSLTHQIDSGLKRNYKESEIFDAVIGAISLHSSLKSYVETLNDLNLDMRNKVDFASKESECEVQYDEPLIQKTFMKFFETGLRDDILAANLRPILRTSGLTDEYLMKQAWWKRWGEEPE